MNLLLLDNFGAIIDISALAFIAIFALIGFMKGFAKTFFSVFGTFIALLLAVLLASGVTQLLQNLFSIIDPVSQSLSGVLGSIIGEDLMNMDLSHANQEILSEAGLAGFLVNIVLAVKAEGSIPQDTTLDQIICPTFAYYIVLILTAIALFILFKFLFRIIQKIIKSAYKFKLIKGIDRGLGLVLGILNGVLSLEFVILLFSILPIAFCQDVYAGIQASVIAKFIEDINLYGVILNALTSKNIIDMIASAITA